MNFFKYSIAKVSMLIVLGLIVNAQAYAMKSPEQVVKDTVDTMVAKLQKNRAVYAADEKALYQMLDETLIPALHVPRMSDLILGRDVAKTASAEKKAEFANEFKTFLLQSYASALLNATGEEEVVYEPVAKKPGADKVKVQATLISAAGEKYPITLWLSNRKDTEWRAYNIEVANVNFIRTYRSSFALVLQKEGIDGLIADLRNKNVR